MQYIKHSFAHNFNAYKQYGEEKLLHDMMVDEIAKLIVFDKGNLLTVIAQSGYTINKKPTNNAIINLIRKNISTDKKLRDNISKLIVINNSDSKNKQQEINNFTSAKFDVGKYSYKNTDGQTQKKKDTLSKLSIQLKESLKNSENLKNKVEQHNINKEMMAGNTITEEQMKSAIRKAYIKSSLITSIIIVGGYFAMKALSKKLPKWFGEGGNVSDDDFVPQAPIPQTHEPSGTQNIPNNPEMSGGDGFNEHGFKEE